MYVRFSKRGRRYEGAQVRAAAVLMTPLVLTLICLFVLPVILVIFMSFTNWSMSSPTRTFVGLKNYVYLVNDGRFWKSLVNTFVYSGLKIVLDTSLALFLAVLLDKKLPLRKFFRIAYFAPVIVPIAASSLIWIWFYDPGIGPFQPDTRGPRPARLQMALRREDLPPLHHPLLGVEGASATTSYSSSRASRPSRSPISRRLRSMGPPRARFSARSSSPCSRRSHPS